MKFHSPLRINLKPFLLSALAMLVLTSGFGQTTTETKPEAPKAEADTGKHKKVKYNSVNTTEKVVAFTFDDGPLPNTTPKLLDILKQHDAKATFFVRAGLLQWNSKITKRTAEEGHEIANHTYNHPDITKIDHATLIKELESSNKSIKAATGLTPKFFRPPFGAHRQDQAQMIYDRYGMSTAMWNLDPQDWKSPGASVVTERIVSKVKPGSVVCCHDIMAGTVEAMPAVLSRLKAQGYKFVTLSELVKYDKPKAE